jgi:hypothetical protein
MIDNIMIIVNILNEVGLEEYSKNWKKYHFENGINKRYKLKPRGTIESEKGILNMTFEYMNLYGYIFFDYNINQYVIQI